MLLKILVSVLGGIGIFFGIRAFQSTPPPEPLPATTLQWDPQAGYVSPHSIRSITATSALARTERLLDGDPKTFWQGGAAFPQSYLGWGTNLLLRTTGKQDTDGNKETAMTIPAGTAIRYFPKQLTKGISLKATHRQPVEVTLFDASGNTQQLTIPADNSYQLRKITFPIPARAFEVRSDAAIQVFEIAGYNDRTSDALLLDFGKIVEVGYLELESPQRGTLTVCLDGGGEQNDGSGTVPILPCQELSGKGKYVLHLETPQATRFLKVSAYGSQKDWDKLQLSEIRVYDRHGPYGAPPEARAGTITVREFLGVNAYWGWGYNEYSQFLPKEVGPALFGQLFRQARNYHDLSWDIKSPTQPADFSDMPNQGTSAKEWVDWDREYQFWQQSGLEPHLSLQLHNLDHQKWTSEAAYNYGVQWATHFGPKARGREGIRSVEIGNEPWAYPPATYRMIFENMARGIRATDPDILILPCALQATDPTADEGLFKNYVGSHLYAQHAPQIDALNVHAYSYRPDFFHREAAVHPEHPQSTFREILNLLRWRDRNLPETPVWLTEFGYDYADSVTPDCTHPVCVSEPAASAYAQRTVLLALRWGLERGFWYFHADEDKPSSLFTRSGLVKIEGKTARKRAVWYAFQELLDELGDYSFYQALREDAVYVYEFRNASGGVRHVGWVPQDIDRSMFYEFGGQRLGAEPVFW